MQKLPLDVCGIPTTRRGPGESPRVRPTVLDAVG